MRFQVFYPLVLYPQGLEYDSTKKQYILCTSENDDFRLLVGPTFDLGDIIRELKRRTTYALNYSPPFLELNLEGIAYSVTALHAGDITDLKKRKS